MTEAKVPVQITLVHGTWARGIPLLATTFWPDHDARWCKNSSNFLQLLRMHMFHSKVDFTVSTFNWSGANSIFSRDRAANDLADRIEASTCASPLSHKVVIAHSHGGNIALRMLQILRQRGNKPLPTVITIATPFLHIDAGHDWSHKVSTITMARFLWTIWVYIQIHSFLLVDQAIWAKWLLGALIFSIIFVVSLGVVQLVATGTRKTRNRIADATSYECQDEAASILVIRGMEDEAGMALTLGVVGIRISDLMILLVNWSSIIILILASVAIVLGITSTMVSVVLNLLWDMEIWWMNAAAAWDGVAPTLYEGVEIGAVLMLLGMLVPGIFKAAFGYELILRSTTLAITANSVPDVKSRITVRTLPRSTQKEAPLLHSLYDHAGCAATIAFWIRDLLNSNGQQ